MARKNHRAPQLVGFASKQAHYQLLERAAKRGLYFHGRPTGVCQRGDKLYLYVDISGATYKKGRVTARIVRQVPPLCAWDYLPASARN